MTLALLLTAVTGAWAGTRATGSFENCTGHNGSIHVSGWAYDPDASATSIFVHAYIWYGESVGKTKAERLPAVGIMADLERADVNTNLNITGNHGFNKYIAVPAGTYTVQIFAIDQNGDGNPPIPGPTSGTNYQTYTVTVDAPFTVSFDANGGSDAPANQDKCTGIDLKLSSDQPVREGYIFIGWNTAQDGSGDSYDPGATYTANADLTLYAQWLKVTLDENSIVVTMEMPAFDVTIDYELVRDMSVQMTAQVGDGTQEQPRYRVKKDGNNKFIPADMEMAAVPALFTVNDAIEQKALTQTQDYIVQIYAIDADGQPTGDPMTFDNFTFEPGIYAVKAVAADGSDYDGETALSNTFKLFQGYEVEVAAKEFITYYKDEPLRVEDEAAELYTVSSVNGDKAVLSDKSDAMPSNTPMLVYNNSDETKVILLIPCNEPDLALTVAPEFKGTLEATEIAASSATSNNYAFNGKQFVWVKTALAVGQYKAWLEVPTGTQSAPILTLVFGNTTGIESIDNSELTIDGWYDLNGRKLQNKPTKKGVYIMNGRKVVVK